MRAMIGTFFFKVEAIDRELFLAFIRFMANLRQSEQMKICFILSLYYWPLTL